MWMWKCGYLLASQQTHTLCKNILFRFRKLLSLKFCIQLLHEIRSKLEHIKTLIALNSSRLETAKSAPGYQILRHNIIM